MRKYTTVRATEAALRRMGESAADYVSMHGSVSTSGAMLMIAELDNTPEDVADTLTRIYGRPEAPYMGETRYWRIEGRDIEVVDA